MSRTRLLPSLVAELYAAEQTAYRMPIRTAGRLGEVLPSIALRAIAAHANVALDKLPKIARERGIGLTSVSALAGSLVDLVRRGIMGPWGDAEHAYRATLLEARRGMDLVRLVRAAAEDEGDRDLVSWCDGWLPVRERLVEQAAHELSWFGRHPDASQRPIGFASVRVREAFS
jgi:hypothetical protein